MGRFDCWPPCVKAESETKRLSAHSQVPWQVSSTASAEPLPMLLLTDAPASQPSLGLSVNTAGSISILFPFKLSTEL